jgi:hypothetical protein
MYGRGLPVVVREILSAEGGLEPLQPRVGKRPYRGADVVLLLSPQRPSGTIRCHVGPLLAARSKEHLD